MRCRTCNAGPKLVRVHVDSTDPGRDRDAAECLACGSRFSVPVSPTATAACGADASALDAGGR